MTDPTASALGRRLVLAVLLGGLLALAYLVLHLFLAPLAWGGILAYVTWPIHRWLRRRLSRPWLSALLMTLLLTAAFVLPLLSLIGLLRSELAGAYAALTAYLADGPRPLPEAVTRIPWLGTWLQEVIDRVSGDPTVLRSQISQWVEQSTGRLLEILGSVGRNAAKLGFALIAVFFFYRDGENLVEQVERLLRRFLGARVDAYVNTIGATARAVVHGLVLTALAQGALAGLGYWVAGVNAPVLLAAVTAIVALIPFGTPFVWGSVVIWLLISGQIVAGVGLLAWGTLVVSWVDNLIRPMLISSATRVPFLLVMFGVLGGIAAFGLVGLFLGPVILAVLMGVWREWLEAPTANGNE